MNEFDYEVLQRKRIASQARYRKNGSKSKKCSLPSDNMTNSQWKERCGKINTYCLNRPLAWYEFKAMPKNLQSEYLRKYIERHHASATDFAEIMFGCSLKTLLNYCKNNELGVQFSRGGYRSPQEKEAFRTFCINTEERLSEEEFSDKTPTCENANVVPQKHSLNILS